MNELDGKYADATKIMLRYRAIDDMLRVQAGAERLLRAMREAAAHLGAALAQTIPSDDQIIIGHVRDAHAELTAALREHEREARP